jgi:hypothetical protein
MRPGQKVFSAVDTSGPKMSLQQVKRAPPHFPDPPQSGYPSRLQCVKYFINISCIN